MIALNAGQSLQVVLAGAKTTVDCPFVANYADVPNAGGIGGTAPVPFANSQNGTTNGVTAVTIFAAPSASGATRQVLQFSLFNLDTGAVTPTIQLIDGAGNTRVITTETLQVGETLFYEDDNGFYCVDTNGNLKTNQPASSSAASTASSQAVSAGTAASQASSEAASAGTAASTASSEAASAGTAASTASSQGASAGTAASTASSAASAATVTANAASSTQSLQLSAGTSVTISKTKSSFGF